MSSWMNNLRVFGRPMPGRTQAQPPSRGPSTSPSATSPSSISPPSIPPSVSPAPPSPSLPTNPAANVQAHQDNQVPKKPPFFFREEYSGFIVKGNFNTLAAKPSLLEEGEWLAHQISEQQRALGGYVKLVQSDLASDGPEVCNQMNCPTMSAGPITYTWIDTNRIPMNLPAPAYTKNILTWVIGKVQNPALFPTDPLAGAPPVPTATQVANDPHYWVGKPSGFPQHFEAEIKNLYKQMFRCWAHLYWQHWLFFWHQSCYRELNTHFVHFINVGRLFGLLSDKDVEPMQPLIDIWVRQGVLSKIERVEAQPVSAGGGVGM